MRSRAPQRPGGVNTAEQIHQALAEQVAYQRVDIIEIVAGRGYGIAGVRYAGNVVRPRNLTGESGQGERMYRATVRREDGSLDELYTIMACGNDIRYDGLGSRIPGRGFNFVADEVVAQEPAPAATPEPAPAPIETPELVLEPTAAIEPIAEPAPPEATVDDGRVLIELKRAAGNLPSMLRLKGIDVNDVSLTIADRETTIRFTETPPRPTRKAK
ncbi:MAG: hypothetical protein ABIT47_02205 [Candidatus Paceibacterota bacterium]